VTRATSTPNTFLFTELLQTPQIQALSDSAEFARHLTLLQIFSYGTYQSYKATPDLPELNEAQTLKLRQLSILSLAKDKANLTYAALAEKLGLSGGLELENTVISTIYAGLITATLDPAHQLVRVSSVAPLRDLAPGSIPALLTTLKAWSGRCESTLAELEAQMAAIRAQAARKAADKAAWDKQLAKAVDEEKTLGEGGGGSLLGKKPLMLTTQGRPPRFGKRAASNLVMDSGQDAADDEAMDVDDEDDGAGEGKKRASRRKL